MVQREPDENEQWEDIIRRLGGAPDQAHTPPSSEPFTNAAWPQSNTHLPGPRDYQVTGEDVEDFQPPNPKPIASGNPRIVLSWFGVVGAVAIWIVAALFNWSLSGWLATVTILALCGGAISLFFLLPKSWAHRERFDGDDYGDGAKL